MDNKKLQQIYSLSTKHCLVCLNETNKMRNQTLYWHRDSETGSLWSYCNRCERGYSIYEYTRRSGLSLTEFLKQDFNFKEASPNEVQKIEWPRSFIPLFDSRAKKGIEYLESRGIDLDDNIFYDTAREGIVFPYYFDNVFCGAQIRLIKPWTNNDGVVRKIDTLPGTRLGLLWYNWNGTFTPPNKKAMIVTEGAFNCLSIKQSLDKVYGGYVRSPWMCVSTSGSGLSKHHIDTMLEMKNKGMKVILAPDSDEAGMKMAQKAIKNGCVTHLAITGDVKKDWNDLLKEMGKRQFAKWFVKSIEKV